MKDLDIDKLLSVMDKPQTGNNIESIMKALEQADNILKQFEVVVNRLDHLGLKPLIVRGLGKQLGVDAESPLKSEYKSKAHEDVIKGLNNLSEADLLKQIGAGANVQGTND